VTIIRNIVDSGRYVAATTLNFVWRHDTRPIYIMDNHRAALWCWMRELAENEPYNLIHIDEHWDLADPQLGDEEFTALQEADTLEDFVAVRDPHPFGRGCPAIRFDNFIAPLLRLRPGLRQGLFHVSQKLYQSAVWDERFRRCTEKNLIPQIRAAKVGRHLLNLDLDYFFEDDPLLLKRRRASDEVVSGFIRTLKGLLQPDSVVTIALSPKCCGGYHNAVAVCGVVCKSLEIEVPEELYLSVRP